jgi:hypothetical protein
MIVRTGLLALLVLCAGCGSEQARKPGPPPAPIGRHLVYGGDKGVWIAEPDGSRPRLLAADGSAPVISPDGKWVVFSGGDCDSADSPTCGVTELVSTELGAKPRPLGGEAGWPTQWSPDSQAIVTERSLNAEEDELVRIEVADGKETTLAHGEFWGWSLSPDGSNLVFALAHGQAPRNDVFPVVDLYVVNMGGGDPKAITNTGDSAYPAWGPKSIAFAKLIPTKYPSPNTEFAKDEIWRIQPDGTGRATISGPMLEDMVKGYWHCIGLKPIDWSDDGRALLGEVQCEGIGKSVAVDPRTGAIRSLGEGTFTVALSHDAQFALVQWGDERVGPKNERVLIYPYAGGRAPTVVARSAFAPSWNR